jgi:hypothetical protein
MSMLDYIAWFALVMSAVNWLTFLLLTLLADLPQLKRAFNWWLAPLSKPEEGKTRHEVQSGVDPSKIAAATGALAGAFKKAGAAPTAAAMSVIFALIALTAAGVGKF